MGIETDLQSGQSKCLKILFKDVRLQTMARGFAPFDPCHRQFGDSQRRHAGQFLLLDGQQADANLSSAASSVCADGCVKAALFFNELQARWEELRTKDLKVINAELSKVNLLFVRLWQGARKESIVMANKEKKLMADDVIRAILEQMEKDGQEFPDYIRAPGAYFAYLHKDDYKRLRQHEDEIIEQAKLKLDEKIKLLEDETARKKSGQGLSKKLANLLSRPLGLPEKSQAIRNKPYRKPANGWNISLSPSDNEMINPGEVNVETKPHASPPKPDTGGLTQVQRGASDTRLKTFLKSFLAEASVGKVPNSTAEPTAKPFTKKPVIDRVYATIQFDDGTGRRVHEMRKPVIVIRCGDQTGDCDLLVKTPPELFSGELRLRHEEKDGEFYFQSSGQSGIKIGGQLLPSAVGSSPVWQAEIKLPPRARINLAGVVVLDFTAC